MAEHRREIAAIAGSQEPPSFENTVVAMEKAGQLLARTSRVFFALNGANTNPELQKLQREMAPKLAAHSDAITLDPALFARVKVLYDKRDALGLDAESKRLLWRYHKDFVRAGAMLPEADKEKLKALNTELAALGATFNQNVLKEVAASAVLVETRAELAGLSEAQIAAAADAAKAAGHEGKFLLRLTNTSGQPPLASLRGPRAARAADEGLARARQPRRRVRQPRDRRAHRASGGRSAPRCSATRTTPPSSSRSRPRAASRPSTSCSRSSARPRSRTRRREAAAMQKLVDAEGGGFAAGFLGLGLLRGEGAQARTLRLRRVGAAALLRARPRAEGRRLLRRREALRPPVLRTQGPAGLRAERARLRRVRQGRLAARRSSSATSTRGPTRTAAPGRTPTCRSRASAARSP